MSQIQVLVVDDHRIFAESLATVLSAEQGIDAVAAGSGRAAARCLERRAADGRRVDVLLVDADLSPGKVTPASEPQRVGRAATALTPPEATPSEPAFPAPQPTTPQPTEPPELASPDVGGLTLVSRVRADHPAISVIVLAERDDPAHAAAALRAGAAGWVAKDCSLSHLTLVVRGVLRGETHLPPALLTDVLAELLADQRHRSESERLVEALTPRELEALRCMVAGLGRKAVAERLGLSPHTVRTHMQNVLTKLDVHSTLAAVALARRAGVAPVSEAKPPARSAG